MTVALWIFAVALILVGIAGTVLPVLPGARMPPGEALVWLATRAVMAASLKSPSPWLYKSSQLYWTKPVNASATICTCFMPSGLAACTARCVPPYNNAMSCTPECTS